MHYRGRHTWYELIYRQCLFLLIQRTEGRSCSSPRFCLASAGTGIAFAGFLAFFFFFFFGMFAC